MRKKETPSESHYSKHITLPSYPSASSGTAVGSFHKWSITFSEETFENKNSKKLKCQILYYPGSYKPCYVSWAVTSKFQFNSFIISANNSYDRIRSFTS